MDTDCYSDPLPEVRGEPAGIDDMMMGATLMGMGVG
jgi:hypothetical protein